MVDRKKLRIVGTDIEELKGIVSGVMDDKFQQQEDIKKKKEHMNKLLKKDEMTHEPEKIETLIIEKPTKIKHSCPSCQADAKKIADGFEICTNCGTTNLEIKKGQKLAICNNCGGVIPESYIGTSNKACPHCGVEAGAHWIK